MPFWPEKFTSIGAKDTKRKEKEANMQYCSLLLLAAKEKGKWKQVRVENGKRYGLGKEKKRERGNGRVGGKKDRNMCWEIGGTEG